MATRRLPPLEERLLDMSAMDLYATRVPSAQRKSTARKTSAKASHLRRPWEPSPVTDNSPQFIWRSSGQGPGRSIMQNPNATTNTNISWRSRSSLPLSAATTRASSWNGTVSDLQCGRIRPMKRDNQLPQVLLASTLGGTSLASTAATGVLGDTGDGGDGGREYVAMDPCHCNLFSFFGEAESSGPTQSPPPYYHGDTVFYMPPAAAADVAHTIPASSRGAPRRLASAAGSAGDSGGLSDPMYTIHCHRKSTPSTAAPAAVPKPAMVPERKCYAVTFGSRRDPARAASSLSGTGCSSRRTGSAAPPFRLIPPVVKLGSGSSRVLHGAHSEVEIVAAPAGATSGMHQQGQELAARLHSALQAADLPHAETEVYLGDQDDGLWSTQPAAATADSRASSTWAPRSGLWASYRMYIVQHDGAARTHSTAAPRRGMLASIQHM